MNAELLDRLPPQDMPAEKAMLGAMIVNNEIIDDVAAVVSPDDCYREEHQKLFECILEMRKRRLPVEGRLLVDELRSRGELEAVGGVAGLGEIAGARSIASNATYYAGIVAEKAQKRGLAELGIELIRQGHDDTRDAADALAFAGGQIDAIGSRADRSETVSAFDAVKMAIDRINELHREGQRWGMGTGLVDFDTHIGGLFPGELVILAARPGMGKTSLALQITAHSAQRGRDVLMFSLEMSAVELTQRMLCAHAGLDCNLLRTGSIDKEFLSKIYAAGAELQEAKFVFAAPQDGLVPVAAVQRLARQAKRKGKLDLVVIDYLGLVEPDVGKGKESRQEQVAKMARGLKNLARELQVPVLCLCQLNRQLEQTSDRRPRLSHLRESGAIEQDADMVMFIHRPALFDAQRDNPGVAHLFLEKNRNGPVQDFDLHFDERTTTFSAATAFSDADVREL